MNVWRCSYVSIAMYSSVSVAIASAQNLTDQWVEKAAKPLVIFSFSLAQGDFVALRQREYWCFLEGFALQTSQMANPNSYTPSASFTRRSASI